MSWFRWFQGVADFPVSKPVGKIKARVFWLRNLGYLISSEAAEARTVAVFEKIVAGWKPELFLDVGANVGDYSWRVANLTEVAGIWLFEPDEKNLLLLGETIRRNDLAQAKLHAVAVSDAEGVVSFLVDGVSGTTGSIKGVDSAPETLHRDYGLSVSRVVPCVALDSFVDQLRGKRVAMKIDVEGAEEKVLRGAETILREVRPVVFVECFDLGKIRWMEELGYAFRDLEEGCNYVAFPVELRESLESIQVMPG